MPLVLYLVGLHPWLMNWGASAAKQAMALSGDEAPNAPGAYFTRAITIDAPPERLGPRLSIAEVCSTATTRVGRGPIFEVDEQSAGVGRAPTP